MAVSAAHAVNAAHAASAVSAAHAVNAAHAATALSAVSVTFVSIQNKSFFPFEYILHPSTGCGNVFATAYWILFGTF